MLTETQYQAKLKKKIESKFSDAFVFKMDPTSIGCQGFPDLIILKDNKWAALEVKRSSKERHQPNQDEMVSKIKEMGASMYKGERR